MAGESAAGAISSLEGAGMSQSAATNFTSGMSFGGTGGRTHFLDELDPFDAPETFDGTEGHGADRPMK